jgi:transcription elongation factor Elf1
MKTKEVLLYILIGLFGLSLIGCIIYIGQNDLSPNENALLSIILTIISIVATWIVSNLFAASAHKTALEEVKAQHLSNLKTYALNAAEKVDNLSNELNRLSVYLQDELEKEDESHEESLISKIERLESSIHIVNTLKSVNDTSLSDWKGVIGEELDEIREEKIERENDLRELVDRVEEVINYQNYHYRDAESIQAFKQLEEIKEIKKELSLALSSIGGPVVKPTKPKSTREKIEIKCPYCGTSLSYTQKTKASSYKTIKCKNCDGRSLSRWIQNKGFELVKEEQVEESITCPWCQKETKILLSNLPSSKNVSNCTACLQSIKLTRKIDGITITKYGLQDEQSNPTPKIELTEEFIQKVKNRLPAQPWPSGIHKIIAEEFNVPNQHITLAIKRLINRGLFHPQVDGVIYYRKEEFSDKILDE